MKWTTVTQRVGYAASDTAGQLVFCVVYFYLLKFYTDVYGLSAAAAGTILLLGRVVDAIAAPVWGFIFDKTNSRWGKSRPWFLWLCLPFAVFGVLTFWTPEWGASANTWYAAGTYIVCSFLYTGINTPVTSILSALTPDSRERVTLTCFRMFGSKLGALVVNLTALKMVGWLGQGNDRLGFIRVMSIYALGAVLLYLFAFHNLEEVVQEKRKSLSVKDSVGAIRGNWLWFIIFLSSLFFWIAFVSRICTVPFFFEYVLHRKDLIPAANSLDFISLATIFFLPALCKWTSKRNIWIVGLFGVLLGQLMIYLGLRHQVSVPWIMAGWIFGFLASGAAMSMPFSLLSDAVDYGEWKTGIRAAGFLTAVGASFCVNAGGGLGGALPAWIMEACGYVPNVAQTARSLAGIEFGFIWVPAAGFALSMIPVWFYKKYELLAPQIQAELAQRRLTMSSPLARNKT